MMHFQEHIGSIVTIVSSAVVTTVTTDHTYSVPTDIINMTKMSDDEFDRLWNEIDHAKGGEGDSPYSQEFLYGIPDSEDLLILDWDVLESMPEEEFDSYRGRVDATVDRKDLSIREQIAYLLIMKHLIGNMLRDVGLMEKRADAMKNLDEMVSMLREKLDEKEGV